MLWASRLATPWLDSPTNARACCHALQASPPPSSPVVAATPAPSAAPSPAASPAASPGSGVGPLSMILSLAGDNLVPWTGVKSTQALAAVAGVLADGGLAVVGADTQLLRAAGNASSGGGRRLRRRLADAEASGVAAIPSLYTIMEAALIRATVQAPAGSQAAVQGVLVASAASGMLATRMRLRGALHSPRAGPRTCACSRPPPRVPSAAAAAHSLPTEPGCGIPCGAGLAVSQVQVMSVYPGTTKGGEEPPQA